MSLVFEVAYFTVVAGAALAIYFRVVDKQLNIALDNFFANWHADEVADMKAIKKIHKIRM